VRHQGNGLLAAAIFPARNAGALPSGGPVTLARQSTTMGRTVRDRRPARAMSSPSAEDHGPGLRRGPQAGAGAVIEIANEKVSCRL